MNPYVPEPVPRKSHWLLFVCMAALWVLALVPGVRYLVRFENTAGRRGFAPSDWHNTTTLSSGDARLPLLLVALHPKCSCSNATLTELEEAAQTFDHPYNAILLIDPPQGLSFDWRKTRAYREAQKALHATVVLDNDGKLAASLGAFTSGDVRLYAAEDAHSRRSLLFAGGVTGSRGMVGANSGVEGLKTAFRNPENNPHATSPVFGCELLSAALHSDEQGGR